jgi:ERF superfamily
MNAVTTQESTALVSATPSQLLAMAVAQGADLDRLERLMALQERWEATEARKAYDIAFTAFKAEAVKIIKNRGVTDGPLKGKRYAELYAVVNAITPALSKHGLSASWKLTKDDKDWLEVTCTLKHVGGHFEIVSMGGPPDTGGAKNAIMARASTVSYLERYTLKAITGLSEQNDDDDGQGAGPSPEDEALLDTWREVALEGEVALKAFYKANRPPDAFWAKHSQSLKEAAKVADSQ